MTIYLLMWGGKFNSGIYSAFLNLEKAIQQMNKKQEEFPESMWYVQEVKVEE